MGRHGRLGRQAAKVATVMQVAMVALVATVTQVATVVHVSMVARVATVAPAVALRALCYYLIVQSVPQRKKHFTITNIFLYAVYTENRTKHKKIQTYRLSNRWGRYLPLGFKGLIHVNIYVFRILC
jgi:hypothetical protein